MHNKSTAKTVPGSSNGGRDSDLGAADNVEKYDIALTRTTYCLVLGRNPGKLGRLDPGEQ